MIQKHPQGWSAGVGKTLFQLLPFRFNASRFNRTCAETQFLSFAFSSVIQLMLLTPPLHHAVQPTQRKRLAGEGINQHGYILVIHIPRVDDQPLAIRSPSGHYPDETQRFSQ